MWMDWFTLIHALIIATRVLASASATEDVRFCCASNEVLEEIESVFQCLPSHLAGNAPNEQPNGLSSLNLTCGTKLIQIEYDSFDFDHMGRSYLVIENGTNRIAISEYCINTEFQSDSHERAEPVAIICESQLGNTQLTIPTQCNTTNCYRKCCPSDFTFYGGADSVMRALCVFNPSAAEEYQDGEQAITNENLLNSFTTSDPENIEIIYGVKCPEYTERKFFKIHKDNFTLAEGQLVIQQISRNISLTTHNFCFDFDSNIQSTVVVACVEFKVSIPKCCPAGQVLNSKGNCTLPFVQARNRRTSLYIPYVAVSTDTYYLLNSTYVEEFPDHDIQCNGSEPMTIVGYANSNDSSNLTVYHESTLSIRDSLVIMSDQFNFDEYCIDELENETNFTEEQEPQNYPLMAKVCNPCANTLCIKKCCSEGYFVNSTTRSCEKFENLTLDKMAIRFVDGNGNDFHTTDYLAIPLSIANVFQCRSYLMDISLVQDRNDFYIMTDSRFLRAPNHMDKHKFTHEYCIEYFIKDDREPTIKAYFCEPEDSQHTVFLLEMYPWFLFTSAGFLAATFLVYAFLAKLREQQGSMSTMSLVGSMSVMFFGMGYMQRHGGQFSDTGCVILASFTHYFFLAAFTWMAIISLDLVQMFRHVQTTQLSGRKQLRQWMYYSAVGWGIPLLFEGITQLFRWYPEEELPLWVIKPRFGQLRCWFGGYTELAIYFYIPIGILVSLNTINFIWAAICYYKISAAANVSRKYIRNRLFTAFRIFVLMGVSWIMELVAFLCGGPAWSVVTDVWNMMQGILIFVLLVCKPNVLKILKDKFQTAIHLFRKVCSVSHHVSASESETEKVSASATDPNTRSTHISMTSLSP